MRAAPIAVYSLATDGDDVLEGLRAPRKRLPSSLLYDARGLDLFDQLVHSEDFYPAHTEHELLAQHAAQIVAQVGPEARVVELASGGLASSRRLVRMLERPISYAPVAASPDLLDAVARAVRGEQPGLEVLPVAADPTRDFELPVPQRGWRRTLAYVPGATIDTLQPSEARRVLARLARVAGDDRLLLLGADSTRDPVAVVRAYDDDSGIAEAFDKNVLAHLVRTRGATFDLDAFEHRVAWNGEASRVERQLVSRTRQLVRIDNQVVTFAPGEAITVEHGYKHTPEALRALLASAGWRPRQVFTSTHRPYRLWLCEALAWPASR